MDACAAAALCPTLCAPAKACLRSLKDQLFVVACAACCLFAACSATLPCWIPALPHSCLVIGACGAGRSRAHRSGAHQGNPALTCTTALWTAAPVSWASGSR